MTTGTLVVVKFEQTYRDCVFLLRGLVTAPLATMGRAKSERFLPATMALAVLACLVPQLLRVRQHAPSLFGVAAAFVGFAAAVIACWKAGEWLHGRGTVREIAQLCGLVWFPLTIVWTACGTARWWRLFECLLSPLLLVSDPIHYVQRLWSALTIGLAVNIFVWFITGYVLMVGHRYPNLETVKYVLVEAAVIHWIVLSLGMRLLYLFRALVEAGPRALSWGL